MKVTLQDVARHAGVSTSTASNALSGKRGVSSETRERIRTVALDIGYLTEPASLTNAHIRLVVFKRSGRVVMDTEFFADILNAISDECLGANVGLMVTNIQIDDNADARQKIQEVCQDDCLGVLVLATEMNEEDILPFLEHNSILVTLDREFALHPVSSISIDNEQAGRVAAQHLLERGHRNVGFIDCAVPHYNRIGKARGFLSTMADAGHPVAPENIWPVVPTIEDAFIEISRRMSEQGIPDFTGCFAFNDIVATSFVRAARQRGITLPDDMSIIGMNNIQLSRVGSPALTTLRVRRRLMARTAVRRILEMRQERRSRGVLRTRIGVDLIQRESVRSL